MATEKNKRNKIRKHFISKLPKIHQFSGHATTNVGRYVLNTERTKKKEKKDKNEENDDATIKLL